MRTRTVDDVAPPETYRDWYGEAAVVAAIPLTRGHAVVLVEVRPHVLARLLVCRTRRKAEAAVVHGLVRNRLWQTPA